ncbi:MAG TPA: lmo0937 family membrane protein [Chloroflexi bacterium]|nr:lmo0937 family membrane protein [Chloroflexota bacterium]
MLWMIAMLLMLLWLLGVMSSHMMGGFIHLLLVVALVMALVHIIQGRRTA